METKLIQKLKDAGVGADVILSLILEDEASPAAPEQVTPEPAASPEPEAPKTEDPKPTAAPAPDPVLAKLDTLIGAIQASNIINMGRGSQPAETVDDILAKMIMPGANKEDK